MSQIPEHVLNDGRRIPGIGFGTYPLTGEEGEAAIVSALQTGYRLIDTAVNYKNEAEVGRALRASGIPRDEITLATKLPGRDHGYRETMYSLKRSLVALKMDFVELYLIHWPNPSVDRFVESWEAMIELQKQGHVGSIGVSNFTPEFLARIATETGIHPAVNQVELHPYFPQTELLAYHRAHGIATEAWSPLGKRAAPYNEPVIRTIAEHHGVSPAQVVLRWHLERGVIPIPKSATPARQAENLAVTDFSLDAREVAAITALGRADGRLFDGDPNTHEEM